MGKVEGRQVAQHQNRQRIEEGQKKHIKIVGVDFFLVLQLIQCNTWIILIMPHIFQGWEFAHSLIAHSLICSSLIHSFAHFVQIKWATMSDSLKTNEWPWANCSGCSRQMSDRERFAQVAQRKWANERFAQKILAKKSKILFFECFI